MYYCGGFFEIKEKHFWALEGDKPSSLCLDRRGDVPRVWHCGVPAWLDGQWKRRSAEGSDWAGLCTSALGSKRLEFA